MKIALFTDNFHPELSGMTDAITRLGTALAARGHSIMFVAPAYSKREYKRVGLEKKELDYGPYLSVIRLPSVPYPASPNGQGRIAFPLGSSLPLLKKFAPDILHTQSPFGAGLEALLASKLLNIPLVGTNHTPVSEFVAYTPIQAQWFKNMGIGYYSWYYNRCRFVSAPCNSLLKEMRDFGFNRSSDMISNPLDLSRFPPVGSAAEKEHLKQRFNLSPHTILYTGRLAPEKHVDVIIRAIELVKKEIPDVALAVTGHGSAETSLRELVASLGLKSVVHFFGFLDDATFPLLYHASDLFAVMSTAEAQCLSLMQAFATGLPSLGARAWALPEYINETNGVIVEPGDHAALAKEIVLLFNDSARMHRLGVGGIQSSKQCAAATVAEKWESIYTTAIAKNDGGAII